MTDVLYVDDEKMNLFLLQRSLRDDFNVITAESGQEALEKLDSTKTIKAIISDMRMPLMNGVEFIKRVRKKRDDLPCFILTGFDHDEEIETALEDHLIEKKFKKPFERPEIVSTLKTAIGE